MGSCRIESTTSATAPPAVGNISRFVIPNWNLSQAVATSSCASSSSSARLGFSSTVPVFAPVTSFSARARSAKLSGGL